MKKITIFTLGLGYGGVEKYFSSLCKMLQDDYKIEIVSTYKVLDIPAFEFSDKINITYLISDKPNKQEIKDAIKKKKIVALIKEMFKAIRILFLRRKRNIDYIKKLDTDYIITTRFHSKLVGKYAKKNIIKIATEHNYHNNDKKYINKIIKSVTNFNYFILVSEELKDFYDDKVKPKCIYIPNVIDKLPKTRSNLNTNNLVSVGRFSSEKGFEDAVEVIKLVKEKIKDVKLYLIGDGILKADLENKVKEYQLENNIIFPGFLNQKQQEKYLLDSSIYLMTSHTESFGLVLIEAMSYGLLCIAFDSANGAKKLLTENGILIKNRDKRQMADEIIRLLNNRKKIEEISEKGYLYCQSYLIDNVKKDWLKLLGSGE